MQPQPSIRLEWLKHPIVRSRRASFNLGLKFRDQTRGMMTSSQGPHNLNGHHCHSNSGFRFPCIYDRASFETWFPRIGTLLLSNPPPPMIFVLLWI